MTTKVITNPKTGKMETVDVYDHAKALLERTRREVREMVSGNTQFHTDTLGPAKPAPEVEYGDWGSYLGLAHA